MDLEERGELPESQEWVEVGSTDGEALPPRGASPFPGFAGVDYGHGSSHSVNPPSL